MYAGAWSMLRARARRDERATPRAGDALGAATTASGATRRRWSSQWREAARRPTRGCCEARASGGCWDVLAERGLTLLVTREYEHLRDGAHRRATAARDELHAASPPLGPGRRPARARSSTSRARATPTRSSSSSRSTGHARRRRPRRPRRGAAALPVRARFLPGLRSTSTTSRSSAARSTATPSATTRSSRLPATRAGSEVVWWPRGDRARRRGRTSRATTCSSTRSPPDADSIARSSRPRRRRCPARRPGHRNFPVDGRGVVFSGATREPVARGLTRPHSARLHERRALGRQQRLRRARRRSATGAPVTVARLPGWTRGLCVRRRRRVRRHLARDPALRAYAPGLEVERERLRRPRGRHSRAAACSAACTWPAGNQIFAVEVAAARLHDGLSVHVGAAAPSRARASALLRFSTGQGAEDEPWTTTSAC